MCRIDRKIDLRFLLRLLQCCGDFGRPPPLRANAYDGVENWAISAYVVPTLHIAISGEPL
jgi:hypothetical protein